MIWWRPAFTEPTRKRWWDTQLSRRYGVGDGLAALLWVQHFATWPSICADNDRDGLRW